MDIQFDQFLIHLDNEDETSEGNREALSLTVNMDNIPTWLTWLKDTTFNSIVIINETTYYGISIKSKKGTVWLCPLTMINENVLCSCLYLMLCDDIPIDKLLEDVHNPDVHVRIRDNIRDHLIHKSKRFDEVTKCLSLLQLSEQHNEDHKQCVITNDTVDDILRGLTTE